MEGSRVHGRAARVDGHDRVHDHPVAQVHGGGAQPPTWPIFTGPAEAASQARRPNLAVGRSVKARSKRPGSNRMADGTMGTTLPPPTDQPIFFSSSQSITPPAATRPYALSPERITASTLSTMFSGSSRKEESFFRRAVRQIPFGPCPDNGRTQRQAECPSLAHSLYRKPG